MSDVEISVVVPVLDEQATVAELHRRLVTALGNLGVRFEIVIVDDGSRDGTATRLRAIEREDERVRVLELTRNFGQMSALVCGLRAARGRVLVTMDGDLQDPPEEIPKLMAALHADVEIACATRDDRHQAAWRRAGGAGVHALARRLTGVALRDFGGQFRAYRRTAVDATLGVWSEGRPFFPLALWLGFRVVEVPVRHDPRASGTSRYGLLALVLLNLELITSFTTAPLLWMLAAGAMVTACSIPLLLFDGCGDAISTPAAVFLAGVTLSSSGMLGLYLARVYSVVAGGRRLHVVRRGPLRDDETSG